MLLAALLLAGCSEPRVVQVGGSTMGSTWSALVVESGDLPLPDLRAGLVGELDTVVAQMSTWEAESDISRFNRAGAGSTHVLPLAFCTVLDAALALARDSGGAFDPTVAPVVEAWGFGPGGGAHTAPDAARLTAARAQVGWQRLAPGCADGQLQQPGGVRLDFSALAPGYAADRLSEWLAARGYPDHLIDVGGEFRARGGKPGGKPWVVGIEDPEGEGGATWDSVILRDQALSTSGDYRRFYIDAGQRRSHTIDPRSGGPVTHNLALVAVLAPTAMQADGWATVLSVLGPVEGLAWAEQRRLPALFLVRGEQGLEQSETTAMRDLLAAQAR